MPHRIGRRLCCASRGRAGRFTANGLGFSSGFKHGPLSAVRQGYPVIAITARGDEAMMINHVNEVTTRGSPIPENRIAIAAERPALRANVDDYPVIPEANRFLSPILLTLPAQLISYHLSVAPIPQNRIDPDHPRKLSKTLTVD